MNIEFFGGHLSIKTKTNMGNPPRVLGLQQLRCSSFCLIAFLLITGWCRAAEVLSGEAEKGNLGVEDPRSQDPGSKDRIVRRTHPKAPPLPRKEDRPPNSTRLNIGFELRDWDVIVENSASGAEVRELIRNICEEAGETRPAVAASLVARVLVAQRGYQRTNYWFENVAFVFDEYLANLVVSATDRPVSVLEVGSFEGGSTLWIAEHLLLHPDSMLICVDLWTGGPDMTDLEKYDAAGSEDRFRHNMAKAPNNERVNAIKGDSLLSLSGLIAAGGTSTFDFIYVDGSHSMKDLLADALLSFRLLKLGGIVIFDDTKHPDFPGVGRAMNAVIEALEEKNCVKVLYDEDLMVARKTAEDPWTTPASVVTMGTTARSLLLSNFAAQPTTTYTA